ncbi:PorT family protein [Pedobacter sp. SD-b]|uniref:PorT family protein n=1 Tax=Pedobacter segetis TaxID=2793069 RepID=A0ABS1BF07_9SPHI|nr:porin family protein [Pedobacter segetis]MBK0381453.1 PorT family protein [Pedobacter segetis]
MKKILLAAFVVLVTSASVFAQFNLGLKAGLNYSTIKAQDKEFDESGILGYQVGAWARIGNKLYLQPEAYIGTKGADLTININSTTGASTEEKKQKFTTLDVPLLLGTKFGVDKLNFRIMAGPAFQFNLDDNSSAFAQATDPNFYKYRDFVTNGQIGAGVDVGNFSVDLRYETSLQDINKSNGQKQNLVHLSLGFKIL